MSNFENRAQKDLVTDAVFTESNEEFILPDYMPEIGRVLRVSATLLPEEHYVGSDGTEFSGRLEYRLLYSDRENTVTEAPLEGRYTYRVHSDKDSAVTYTEERIESVNARPSAPRKLGIRTRILARPHVLIEEAAGVPLSTLVQDAPVETIAREVSVLERNACFSGALHAEGRFTVEETSADALTLIAVQSGVLPETREAHDGYLSVRGRLIFTLLLQKMGEAPFVKVCTLPFEEEITAKDAKKEDRVVLTAHVASPNVTFEEDGENTALLLDTEYYLTGTLLSNRTVSVLEDLYVHGARHDIARRQFNAEKLIGCAAGNLTVSAELPLPADIKMTGCLFPRFSLKDAAVSRVGDKATVEGRLDASLLCFGSDEIEKCDLTLPFRAELPLGGVGEEGESFSFSVTPVGGGAQVSGEKVRLSTELAVSLCSVCPVSLSLPFSAVKTGDIEGYDPATVLLYYPTDGDTLWSVGKRYGVPLADLKRQNGIPEEEESTAPLDGYSYLFTHGL